jgi:hypothetical protein
MTKEGPGSIQDKETVQIIAMQFPTNMLLCFSAIFSYAHQKEIVFFNTKCNDWHDNFVNDWVDSSARLVPRTMKKVID